MKYKVEDKVKIKTWDQMKKEFGTSLTSNGQTSINCGSDVFNTTMEEKINSII